MPGSLGWVTSTKEKKMCIARSGKSHYSVHDGGSIRDVVQHSVKFYKRENTTRQKPLRKGQRTEVEGSASI